MRELFKIGLLLTVTLLSLIGLDIKTYYELDIKAMELTLEGSKERLKCLKENCPLTEQYAIDDKVQQKIAELYTMAGTTPSKHIGYYMQHSTEAKAYYDNNETLQERYKKLQKNIEEINTQLKTVMEGNR